MYQHFMKTVLVTALAVAMAGCGAKSIKPTERKPAKLINIQAPVSVISQVASVRLDSSKSTLGRDHVKSQDVIDLRVAPVANGFIAASRGGVVTAVIDGKTVWQLNVGDAITSAVGMDISGTTAVVGTRSGKIIAIDAQTGSQRWTADLSATSLAPALVMADRVIVTTNGGTTIGLDIASGSHIWQYSAQAPNTSVRGMAKPLQLDTRTVLVGSSDGRIHAIDAITGAPIWVRRIGLAMGASEIAKLRDVDAAATVAGNHLYAVSYGGKLVGFDMSTGRTLFDSDLSSTDELAVLDGAVIGSSSDGEVVAFDRITGEQLWQNEDLKYRGLTNPVVIGQYIAVGDQEGVIHVLDAKGQIISRVSSKGQLTSLTVVGNRLYTQSTDGVVSIYQF